MRLVRSKYRANLKKSEKNVPVHKIYVLLNYQTKTNIINQYFNLMKKIIFSVMLLCSSSIGFAQLLDISSAQKVNLPEGTAAEVVAISPNGDYLLLSDMKKQGLQKFDLSTSELQTVTTAPGAAYDAKIIDNGNTIVFRENHIGKDLLKKQSLNSIDLKTGKKKVLVKATRDLQGVVAKENAVYVVNKRKVSAKTFKKTSADKNLPIAFIEYGQLMISQNGKANVLSPNGQSGQSYLWPSVSPDGTKVVYYLATKGAYTCNIDGSDVTYIGNIRAPKWYDNDIVIGMHDTDNGTFVTSSEVIAYSADGKEKQVLSEADKIAMYPAVSADGEKIAFSTPAGEAFIINVKKK